jgi:hypothetical protein
VPAIACLQYLCLQYLYLQYWYCSSLSSRQGPPSTGATGALRDGQLPPGVSAEAESQYTAGGKRVHHTSR